jgi:glyoxylase-like metal-dependent hydrolase (beta-lactamase superfamily II)
MLWNMAGFYRLDSSHHIYPVRSLLGYFHVLYDAGQREVVLIDTGLAGEMWLLRRTLKRIGCSWSDIRAILLTHGHLDHTGHLAEIKRLSGAPVLAHPAEQPHIDGNFPYRGASRVCGVLEACGRALLRYHPAPIDEPLSDNAELPYWGGLRVVHLPGHTQGHCGFLSPRFDLLFTGDLFASYGPLVHLPPAILNSCPEHLAPSLQRVLAISPRLIIPNHYLGFDSESHRRKFDRLVERHQRRRLRASAATPRNGRG